MLGLGILETAELSFGVLVLLCPTLPRETQAETTWFSAQKYLLVFAYVHTCNTSDQPYAIHMCQVPGSVIQDQISSANTASSQSFWVPFWLFDDEVWLQCVYFVSTAASSASVRLLIMRVYHRESSQEHVLAGRPGIAETGQLSQSAVSGEQDTCAKYNFLAPNHAVLAFSLAPKANILAHILVPSPQTLASILSIVIGDLENKLLDYAR